MAKFGAEDPYQQEPLERRKIIEASHTAAIKMAEMLGQDANFHTEGAQSGQHAAIPIPNEQHSHPQEIKLFLSNRTSPSQEYSRDDEDHETQTNNNKWQDDYGEDEYTDDDTYNDLWDNPTQKELLGSEYEQEELITDILEKRAASFHMAFQPPEPVQGPADTLFIVRRSKSNGERVYVRAHSQVLSRTNDVFDELIGCRPPMTPTIEESKEPCMKITWKDNDAFNPSCRKSMYSKLTSEYERERKDKYLQSVYDYERDKAESKKLEANTQETNTIFNKDDNIKENNSDRSLFLTTDQRHQSSMERHQSEIKDRPGQDFQVDSYNQLAMENVIGSLKDSVKPSLIKDFLDASQNLAQLPGWDHLPLDIKQSFEKFSGLVNKLQNPDLEALRETRATETEMDGKSLESNFLGLVGRGGREMSSILNKISLGIIDRRASKVLLEKAKHEELKGVQGNSVSATTARTSLERRKSHTYMENQQRRASMMPLQKQDKRITPSFLKRRQSKDVLEVSKQEFESPQMEDLNLRRKRSKASITALERRKRLSALGYHRLEELEFSEPYNQGLRENSENTFPLLQARLRAPGKDFPSKKKSSTAAIPSLSHTRDEDKEDVIRFYEDEDVDPYATSSTSSIEPAPTPLPKDVKFVIEKMHWTADILHALMEFIYTETLHIHCEELPHIYKAAREISLFTLVNSIRLKSINKYYRLALENEENRRALLDLANQLTSSFDYENFVNKNEDFVTLKKLCEGFELNGTQERKPYTLLLETGHAALRNTPFVTQGFHFIEGQMVLILKDPREGTRLFEQNKEEDEYLTFGKKLLDKKNERIITRMHWLGKWPPIEKTKNREKAWKIYFFDFPDLQKDIPLKNFIFYRHISSLTLRPIGKEEFSVRVVCGLLICPVLYKALHLAFPKLDIVAGRGAGYYLGGETHGNNITMTGDPLYLLRACKSLPRHLIGRTVLRVACPSQKTFVRLWMSTNRFGVDLECNVLYFLKPIIQIQKILEYWHDLDMHAKYVVTHPREMVELVEPHDPF